MQTKSESGLTLVELLITVAVLAIVSAIAVPVVNNVIVNASAAAKATETKVAIEFVEKWDLAGASIQIQGTQIISDWDGVIAQYAHVPDGYSLVGTGTESDPYILALDLTKFESSGTITDSSGTFSDGEGTTYVRDGSGVTITTASANWESMTFSHTQSGPLTSDTVTKKMSHGSSSGIVTKLSNTQVRIAIPESDTFTFGIIYNGGSTGSYTFS